MDDLIRGRRTTKNSLRIRGRPDDERNEILRIRQAIKDVAEQTNGPIIISDSPERGSPKLNNVPARATDGIAQLITAPVVEVESAGSGSRTTDLTVDDEAVNVEKRHHAYFKNGVEKTESRLRKPATQIMLLKNHHTVKEGNHTTKTLNTCGLDAVAHIYMALYAENNNIARKCTHACFFSKFLEDIMSGNYERSEIYQKRNLILRDIFKDDVIEKKNLTEINAACNINILIEQLLCEHFKSFRKEIRCENCSKNRTMER